MSDYIYTCAGCGEHYNDRQYLEAHQPDCARIAALEAENARLMSAEMSRAMSHGAEYALDVMAAENAALKAELAAARADLARYVVGTDAERESGKQVLTRLVRLLDEWERADCTSSTLECAEQVRAILRGEGPQGWEMRAGKEDSNA